MATISFTVPGLPVGKGRPRFSRRTGRAYTPTETASYESKVALAAESAGGFYTILGLGAVAVHIDVFRPIPKSWSKKRREGARYDVRRPDADNFLKLICDAMNGIVYADDAQIAIATVTKRFDATPRVEVTVTELEG